MVSSGKEELPICAEPLSTTSNVVLQREQHETLRASTHKPFDLMKDGGDLISAILGQKAEDQIPNFRGGATEYPAWEEAIAPIRYCSFRQPIMKFNAIKKSLSGEALEIVKWIGLDQPDPVEALVDALKKEYGRPEIVIRAQEVRLEKLASPKEDDYPTLRNFVIAVKSIIATMKAHGYDVEKNPQFTRQLERKLNWVLVKRWCQKRNGDTPNHLLDFLEKEAEILQKAHLLKPDVITGQRTAQVVKAKERALIGVGNTLSEVLSILTSVFDPLGIVGPFVLKGKLIMQAIWRVHPEWKAPLSEEWEARWQQWASDVKVVATVSIPRWYGIDRGKPSTMHVFVDAATVGYGSVAYLAQGMTTAFVAARSRVVNPLKTTTVPRLELQAFIVGVRLADTLLKELETRLVIGRVVFWSDSLVVLYWINSDENRYLPFVSNRLREINETLQSCQFKDRHVEVRYVPSKENPADLISRGMDATGLIKRFDFWTTGPKFLKREEEWPETKVKPPDNDLELRPKAIAFFVGSNSADADKCSTVAEFLKQRLGKDTLNCEDFDREEKKIIKDAQMEDFGAEIAACNKASGRSYIPRSGALQRKQVFLDQDGILRVVTRLTNAEFLSEEMKNPIVMPRKHPVTRLVIRSTHNDVGHLGVNSTRADSAFLHFIIHDYLINIKHEMLTNAEFLSEEMKNPIVMPRKHPVTRLVIRSTHNDVGHLGVNSTRAELGRRFFIPKCISTVKHEIYKCKVCRTHRPIAVQVPTAPLHVNRLQYRGFPFVMCGMDFFGPFIISRKQKRWGLIFMCLTTRAIHLEDCVSTNVESFLLALERFIQRRGKPQSIRSDQGTSFVKAAKEQDKSVKALTEELECQAQDKWRIDFKFNPPGAPHWGGSWERMVQEIKKILMSTVESVAGLHQEAFRTLIVRVEGILNRRPITIDENGHSVCPMDIVSPGNKETQGFPTEASTLEVLRQVRQAAQRFWKRWYQFYLASLSADRNHGGKGQIDIRSGDTVLLKEGSNPLVDSYITAKVVEVFRSNDGYVRSAMLKTANGKEVVRDIRRISIMEGPAVERMEMPVIPPASGGVSHPELAKYIELTTRSSEAHNGRELPTAVAVSSDLILTGKLLLLNKYSLEKGVSLLLCVIALVNWKYGSEYGSISVHYTYYDQL
ncbi:hypothetical protein T06_3738 [Trichinella sp. T6]|nr:hypothetical protein T06_3738 [Trichinella sp. T6]